MTHAKPPRTAESGRTASDDAGSQAVRSLFDAFVQRFEAEGTNPTIGDYRAFAQTTLWPYAEALLRDGYSLPEILNAFAVMLNVGHVEQDSLGVGPPRLMRDGEKDERVLRAAEAMLTEVRAMALRQT